LSASIDVVEDWHDFIEELRELDTFALLRAVITDPRAGRVALVSSFGTEAAVLIHLVASVDKSVPVILVNTRKLFGETLSYARQLAKQLGLTGLKIVQPDTDEVNRDDPGGDLWRRDPDACCHLRKVLPLERALTGVDTWISGRKRYHGGERASLNTVEIAAGRLKVNPLATWTREDLETYFLIHELPRHPLEPQGYLSIGCLPCTERVADSDDIRAGRWQGRAKTECGIHISSAGVVSARLPKR